MANRKYQIGAIWQVPDQDIKFPKNLFRTKHKTRVVVIVENSVHNFDTNEEYILVAPLSSQILEHHKTDIFIEPNNLNQLDKQCYIRMRAIQFISKSALIKYVGKLDEDNKYDILFTIQSFFNYRQA